MSAGNFQQKKSRTPSRIPSDDKLGSGDERTKFYRAARPETLEVYEKAKLGYKNTPEEDAEEMFMDKIMTVDEEFAVDRKVIVLTRFKTYDESEWLLIQEEMFGRTSIGNPHRFVKMRGISSHDEPEIEQRMIPGMGEQIRKKGESVLYHKTIYDIKFEPEAIAEAFTRVSEPLRLQLYVHEQGQRPWRVRNRKIWETYDWEDLMRYCRTGETKETRSEKLLAEMKNLSPQDKVDLIQVLLKGVDQAGMQISMKKTEDAQPPTDQMTAVVGHTEPFDETAEEDDKPKKGTKK